MGRNKEISRIQPIHAEIDGEEICLTCQSAFILQELLLRKDLTQELKKKIRAIIEDREKFVNNW